MTYSELDLELPEYSEKSAVPYPLGKLEDIIKKIALAAEAKLDIDLRLVLLIDEMDALIKAPCRLDLLDNLRYLITASDIRAYVRLILAGSDRFLDTTNPTSPLCNVMNSYCLEPFTIDDVQSLMRQGDSIPLDVASAVIQQGGGHPFILQHILHYLVKNGSDSATTQDVAIEVQRFIDDRSVDLVGWWAAIGENGRRAYRFLANKNMWVDRFELVKAINNSSSHIEYDLRVLRYHGFVERDSSFQNYRALGKLFQDWALARPEYLLQKLTVVQKKEKLANFLLSCPNMSHRHTREIVIKDLKFSPQIPRNETDLGDVCNIVNTALLYENGLEELIERLRYFEGDSIPMRLVDDFIHLNF